MTELYRHWGADNSLLYVGISLSSVYRLSQHKQKPWYNDIARVSIERFPDRQEAINAEREAIKKERPIYNQSFGRKRKLTGVTSKKTPLEKYLDEEGLGCREFGLLVGVSTQAIWHYISGKRVPRKAIMKRIIEETNGKVTAGSFYS